MAQPSLPRPLRESDLAHEARLDPVMPASRGRPHVEGRRLAPERRERPRDALEARRVESGAHFRHVDQLAPLIETDMEGPEAGARALGLRVAADHEFLPAVAFDLDPVRRPPAGVRAREPLRHDPLEPHLGSGLEECLAVLQHVIAALHRSQRRHDACEELLALRQCKLAQVVPLEPEAVEEDAAHRNPHPGSLDVARLGEVHARLEPLEAGPSALVLRDDLAVQHESIRRQRAKSGRDLRIPPGDVLAAPPDEDHTIALSLREHPHAVVLDLEAPVRTGGRALRQRGQHERHGADRNLPLRRAQRPDPLPERLERAGHVPHLLDRESRDHRLGIAIDRLLLARGTVRLLEQEPFLLLLAHAHERPAPAELESEELQLHLSTLVLLERILGLEGAEPPVIPHDDRSGSVVPCRDDSLERAVLQRMVLDVDRQPLLLHARRGPFGHRPTLERSVQLEAEVVMHVARPVLLDDEPGRRTGRGLRGRRTAAPEGLGRPGGVPLLMVFFEMGTAGRAQGI